MKPGRWIRKTRFLAIDFGILHRVALARVEPAPPNAWQAFGVWVWTVILAITPWRIVRRYFVVEEGRNEA